MSAAVAVQDAVYAALVADSALRAYLGGSAGDPRIYPLVARAGTQVVDTNGNPSPYLILGAGPERPFGVMCRRGWSEMIPAAVWVPIDKMRLGKVGMAHVRRILDGATLTLTGHETMSCTVGESQVIPDPAGGAVQVRGEVGVDSQEAA